MIKISSPSLTNSLLQPVRRGFTQQKERALSLGVKGLFVGVKIAISAYALGQALRQHFNSEAAPPDPWRGRFPK